jgi:hypothetical protein
MDNQDKGNNKELENKAKMLDTQSLVLTQVCLFYSDSVMTNFFLGNLFNLLDIL